MSDKFGKMLIKLRKCSMLMLIAVVSVIGMSQISCRAESDSPKQLKKGFKIKFQMSFDMDMYPFAEYYIAEIGKDAKNVKIKAGNEKIVSTYVNSDNTFSISPGNKAGSTTVTITATVKGENLTYSGTAEVKKCQSPFKKFKINKINYVPRFKMAQKSFEIYTKGKKINVEYELNPGWKIKSISYRAPMDSGKNVNVKALKKQTFSFSEKGKSAAMFIDLKNSKLETGSLFIPFYFA